MGIEHIVAVGAGRMGRGIAHVMAYAGFEVTMLDMKVRSAESRKSLREAALGEVETNLKTLATLNLMAPDDLMTILSRIRFAGPDQAAEVLAKADAIFEGVPEIMDLKATSLKEISQLSQDAIIASTTSTFDANELASLGRLASSRQLIFHRAHTSSAIVPEFSSGQIFGHDIVSG